MRITWTAAALVIRALLCLASNDSPLTLTNKNTGFCLVKTSGCLEIRWTTGDRLLVPQKNKCLGVQGKSVGSEISLYDCDETSELQKWECRNETVLALKGQEFYIDLTADNTAFLSRTAGPNSHLTISGTSSGACTRTHRELYTIEGNAAGRPCMFPFFFEDKWYSDCISVKSERNRPWCAVETKFENGLWGFCPTNSKENWNKDATTGMNYQLNTNSALTWAQAEVSCKQQAASLLSITEPHEQAYISALLGAGSGGRGNGYKLWTGLILDPEHGWQWSDERPYRYLNWDSGYPNFNPGHICGIIDGTAQYSWQSSKCDKKLGYICYSKSVMASPTEASDTGFCSSPWIPFNGHCFYLNRTQKSWSEAQSACRKEGGDLASIHNVEEQSFVVSQLGYASRDELWIGLNDKKKEGLFDWCDHSTVSYTSWEASSPTVNSRRDCVLMRGQNGNWADRDCKEKHGFICMKKSASEPTGDEVEQNVGCKTGWKRYGSYCYFVGTETKTFDEADKDCKSSDSYLADVSSGVDNVFLVSLVGLRPEKHFWLGLSNQKHLDFFEWTNTDSVRFTHWNAQMPGHYQGCVAMATGEFAGLWDLLPCTNKEKYICKHLAKDAVLTPAPPTAASPKCADGWTKLPSRNVCYKYEESSKTWFEARDYCRAIGGDLISIHSENEMNALKSGYATAWIGLSAPDPITSYVWSDGSPVNYQNWAKGQPDTLNNVEYCAVIKFWDDYKWDDVRCESLKSWICQIRGGQNPKPTPNPTSDPISREYNVTSDGWMEWNGNQYYINNNTLAMEDARSFCKQRHGDLIIINSEAESTFLFKQVSKDYWSHWIGLTVDPDGTFQWMDGSQVLVQMWDNENPRFKNYDENCAVMSNYNGFWHNYNCGYEFRSICKRSSSTPANTTVAPTQPPKGGCQLPWKKFNSKCYSIFTDNLTWDRANQTCKQMGGNLASISSRQVEVFLMSQMVDVPARDLWIGFHGSFWEGYYWTDGQPNRYINLGLNKDVTSEDDDHYMWSKMWRKYGMSGYNQQCVVINTNPLLGTGKWIKKSCNATNGFICLRNLDPSQPDSTEPTTPTNYIKILNDSIKVITQQMDWDAAQKHCKRDDASLASFKTEWTQAYVELLALNLKTPLWIGLNKLQTNGYFRYVDGWDLKFTHWGKNEPSTNRACVYVDVDGKWKTAYCNQSMNSVCMTSTDVRPTESALFQGVCPFDPENNIGQNHFWLPFRGYCYMFFREEKDWSQASTSCIAHGGQLVSIEDPFEQEFILKNVKIFQDSYTSFWIGLFKTQKGEWQWLDKKVMDYSNLGEGQPKDHNYGEISTIDGTWKATKMWHDKPYICKTPKVLAQKPLPTVRNKFFHQGRSYTALIVVLVIAVIAIGAIIAVVLFKNFGHQLPIPDNLTSFDNPLFFNKQSEVDLVSTNVLAEKAVENTETLINV
ncbi:macrophage mannose receptor 1-like isoform 2-T2 [Pholidichthys leucotaenia]